MSIQIDRQITQKYTPVGKEFFSENSVDTVKTFQAGVKTYTHFNGEDVQTFRTKKALRRALSQESGGAWVEKKEGKMRYFVDKSGWFNTSFKEVSKEECFQSPSAMQKVLGLGLGILAIAPGLTEFARHIPKEAGMGLLALNQRSSALGILGFSFLPMDVDAQAVGSEFQINNFTTGDQLDPDVTSLYDGGYFVVWQSFNVPGGDRGEILAQRYNADGSLFGQEFLVNSLLSDIQSSPSVISFPDGYLVVWSSRTQDGDGMGIFGQRFGQNGSKIGNDFQINTYNISHQERSEITRLSDGGFVVVWQSAGQDGDNLGVYGQMYNTNGTIFGSEFQVNNYTTSIQADPDLTALESGGFIAVWQSLSQRGGSGYDTVGQIYNPSGQKVGEEFFAFGGGREACIIAFANEFIVFHQIINDGWEVFGSRINYTNTSQVNRFRVNNYTSQSQELADACVLRDGTFVVVWQSDGQDGNLTGIFGQHFFENGTRLRDEFQVNSYTLGRQDNPKIAAIDDGGYVVVWQSEGQDGDGKGIFGKRFDANGIAVGPSPLTSPGTSESITPTSSIATNFTIQTNPTATTETSSSLGLVTPLLINIVYSESYPVTLNGQTIGTFSINGGDGLNSTGNPNTLDIQIDPNYELQDGDTLTLFSVPDGESLQWEGITLSSECFGAEGEQVFNQETSQSDYQIVFHLDEDSCLFYTGAPTLRSMAAAFMASN